MNKIQNVSVIRISVIRYCFGFRVSDFVYYNLGQNEQVPLIIIKFSISIAVN
jgi:hypothetical protein